MIARIQYITNGSSHRDIIEETKAVLEAGVDWVQLRIKDQGLDFLVIAKEVKQLCEGRAKLIINDKVAIAKKIEGKEDIHPERAREILGEKAIIGGTANTLNDIRRIEKWVDYIGLGPFKFTTTKKQLSPVLGLEGYQRILEQGVSIPVVAIGGINEQDAVNLIEQTHVHGIAVSGLIKNAQNKKQIVESLIEAIYGKVENRR